MGNKFGDAYREERRRIHREAMRPRRERQQRDMGQRAVRQVEQHQKGPRHTQYVDDEVRVQVQSGYSHDRHTPTSDFLITPRDGSGDRVHHVLDSSGDEIYNEWHDGR